MKGNGYRYTRHTFQVTDNGGTPGQPLDQSAHTLTINVTSVIVQAVDGIRAGSVTGVQTCALPISDFPFTDPNDSPANGLDAVKITTLPATGTLKNNGVAVVAGDRKSVV